MNMLIKLLRVQKGRGKKKKLDTNKSSNLPNQSALWRVKRQEKSQQCQSEEP